MRILFLNYNYLPQFTNPEKWIHKIRPFIIVPEELAKSNEVFFVGQIRHSGKFELNKVHYVFIDPGKKTYFPFHFYKIVKEIQAEIIIVPGFHFPMQLILLRFQLGRRIKIIGEYHADKPGKGIQKILQKLADRFISAYHFTSISNAREWLETGIIRNEKKCFEISSASVSFTQKNKSRCRQQLGIASMETILLWVGRLNKNKDPLTVLNGFEKFSLNNPSAKLYMIYQGGEMEQEIKTKIAGSEPLRKQVKLQGEVQHEDLNDWYSAADFFISGSHREGGSLALLEAIACGCIPVVTNIPAAMKVIEDGRYGFYYEPGDAHGLLKILTLLPGIQKKEISNSIIQHYKKNYSPEAVAGKIEQMYTVEKANSRGVPSSVSLYPLHQKQ